MVTRPFFAVTVGLFQVAGGTQTYEFAHGATPRGWWATTFEALEANGTLYASDDGYTTKSTDAGGIVIYPPIITDMFSIDRQMPLEPGDGAGAFAFGLMRFSDRDGTISALMRSWSIDAQTVTIKIGWKSYEDFDGYRSMRSTKGWYFDIDMVLQEASAYTVRWDYSTGSRVLMNETASTNYVPNPRAEGGTTGSPGSSPTGWTLANPGSGLTRTIVGFGTENGIPYVDTRLSGTASGAITAQNFFVSTTAIPASVGQTWVGSAFVKLQAGSLTGVSNVQIRISEVGGSSSPNTSQTFTPTAASLASQRRQVARTLSVSDTTNIRIAIAVTIPNGATVDFTLRLGAPQAEQRSSASSIILPPSGSPATSSRDDERLYTARRIWTSPALASLSTMFIGLAGAWTASEDGVTVPINDASYWLDRPAQATTYAGSGTYEGVAALATQRKPKMRGVTYNVTPVLIDPTNLIYQYNDGPGTIQALYERGAEVITFESDTTDLYSGSTTSGKYRTDNSRGMFQLGATPQGQITVDATGQFPTAGSQTTLAAIARYLMTEDAAVPSSFVDTSVFTTMASSYPYAGGIYIAPDTNITTRQAVAAVLSSFGAKLVTGRDGKLKPVVISASSFTSAPAVALGTHNIISISAVALPSALSPPPYRIRVAYQTNYTVQTDVSASATAAHREFVARPERYAGAVSSAIQASYRRPNDLPPFGGLLSSQTDAQAVADAMLSVWAAPRRLFAVTVPLDVALNLDIGTIVQIVYPFDILRFGAIGIIVQEQFRAGEATTIAVLV